MEEIQTVLGQWREYSMIHVQTLLNAVPGQSKSLANVTYCALLKIDPLHQDARQEPVASRPGKLLIE